MPNKSRASRRRPRTDKTYQKKLAKVKNRYAKREEARKKWPKERLEKANPFKPLEFYVEKLRKPGSAEPKKKVSSITARQKNTWW